MYVGEFCAPRGDAMARTVTVTRRTLEPISKMGTAFGRRCIPPGRVAPSSNTPGILGRRALPGGRLAALGATPPFLRWVLEFIYVSGADSPNTQSISRRTIDPRVRRDYIDVFPSNVGLTLPKIRRYFGLSRKPLLSNSAMRLES